VSVPDTTSPTYFLDSSAAVKAYIHEQGTSWVQALLTSDSHDMLAVAHIGLVEMAAAFAAQRRASALTLTEYDQAMNELLDDMRERYIVVSITQPLIEFAIELTRRRKLRGCDAIQLAAALTLNRVQIDNELPALTFVCADHDLLIAAQAEGLRIENPNDHP